MPPDPFSEDDKIKILLWCDRHCCLCDNSCGTNIVCHHIEQEGQDTSNIDNAIPLCLNCHGEIQRYNRDHPVGTNYRIREIKARRDQIYERYTRHLVPSLNYSPFQRQRNDPENNLDFVGFQIGHLGDSLPVQITVEAKIILGDEDKGLVPDTNGYYSGETRWNINPRRTIIGGFHLPEAVANSDEELKIEFRVTIIDQYGREHKELPQCWGYLKDSNSWNLEPRQFTEWH